MTMRKRRGFTLVEVLIAMAIFALLSAMTFQALEGTLRTQERVESYTQEINGFMVVWSVMLQDFIQMARRPVRDKHGDVRRAFINEESDDCAVSFTRAGVASGVYFSPSGMQRVSYCLDSGDLYREVSPVLDQVHESEPSRVLLLEDVDTFVVEIESPLKSLRGTSSTPEHEALPLGKIKVVIETSDGQFSRYFPGVDIQ